MRKILLFALLLISLIAISSISWAQTAQNNLMIIQADASASNTTCSLLELSPTNINQLPINTIAVSGTGTNAIRVSGSATSTLYASNSNDGSLFCFSAANNTNTSANTNTLNPRAVVTVNQLGIVSLATTYTGTSGNQPRSATTVNNTDWFIGDQGGVYSNNTSAASPAGNFRSLKPFNGVVYYGAASTTITQVGTISSNVGGTAVGLNGLASNSALQDYYLVSSGNNGSAVDILYTLSATSNTAGSIAKFSLVNGQWVSNGTYTTNFGGFGLVAKFNAGTTQLYVTSGQGALTANSVIKLSDTTGYNAAIGVATSANQILYTAPVGKIVKGIAFAPIATATIPSVTTMAVTQVSEIAAQVGGNVTSNGGLTLTSKGVLWDTISNPLFPTTNFTNDGTGIGTYTSSITNLLANKQYFYKAYAVNANGTAYGFQDSLVTLAQVPSMPIITNITSGSLQLTIGADSNPLYTEYSIKENISGLYVQANGTLSMNPYWSNRNDWGSVVINGLAASTTYSFSVIAKNLQNVATTTSPYNNITTLNAAIPNLSITPLNSFGNICINTITPIDSFILSGINLNNTPIVLSAINGYKLSTQYSGLFDSVITLTANSGAVNQTIYIRFEPTQVQSYNGSLNINGGGANSIALTVSGAGINTLPSLGIGSSSSLGLTTATITSNVVAQGCNPITAYGFEYSTVNGFASGTGIVVTATTMNNGIFSVNLQGLNPATTYYFKSFAQSNSGTNYSSQYSFQTVTPATVNFISSSISVNEQTTQVSLVTKLTNSNAFPTSVQLTIVPMGTATIGDDYQAPVSMQYDWLPNANNVNDTIVFTINNDNISENAEYFVVKLANPVNAVLPTSANNLCTVFILDNDKQALIPTQSIKLNYVTSFSNGAAGVNSAEISSYDSASRRLFIVNSIGAKLEIVNFSNPALPTLISSISITPYGNINSVAVKNGIVAAAIENSNPQANGKVVFFDINGVYLNEVTVGAMPDMITFNHSGTKVLTANEGEPNAAYTYDPEGSVSIIDLSNGITSLSASNVSTLGFTSFNSQISTLKASGVRIFGPNATVAQDIEPEYITMSDDDMTAYVTCQENNAIAVVDLVSMMITEIRPLGLKDHSLVNNSLDPSDQTNAIQMANWPIKGMYMPDAIASYKVGGQTFLVTANEGDSREYSGYSEIVRLSASNYILDTTAFPFANVIKSNLGRLNVTRATGDTDGDGDIDEIHAYGARSISIWNASTGALVWDSGDDIENIIAKHPQLSAIFNASNANNTFKNRSDDKGPEPEGVTVATILGKTYAFVALERIGGCLVYDITNPANPIYVDYKNSRNITAYGGDNGAEGIIYINENSTSNGKRYVVLSNEVSSTISVFEVVDDCIAINKQITTNGATNFCSGSSVTLTASNAFSYLWNTGDTTKNITVSSSGNYSVKIYGQSGCVVNSDTISVNVTPVVTPTVNITSSYATICQGTSIMFQSAAQYAGNMPTYKWQLNGIDIPGATNSNYSTSSLNNNDKVNLILTSNQNCVTSSIAKSDTLTIIVLNQVTPSVTISTDNLHGCYGGSKTLNATILNGGTNPQYQWFENGNPISAATNASYTISPLSQTNQYTVQLTSNAACATSVNAISSPISITVDSITTAISSSGLLTLCNGGTVTLSVGNATSYQWSNGATTPTVTINAATVGNYYVTKIDSSGCIIKSDSVLVVSKSMPSTVKIKTVGATTICSPGAVLFSLDPNATNIQGFNMQWNLNGTPISGATDTSYTATAISGGTVTLTVSGNGCAKTSGGKSYSIKPLPVATFTAGGPTTICAGQSVTLTAPTITGYTYTWLNNGVSAGSGASKVFKVAGVYSVVATLGGCKDTSNNTVSVVVNPLPVAGITALTPATFCAGDSCTMQATPAGATTYAWINGTTTVTTSTNTYATMVAGTFKMMVTDGNGCVSKVTTASVKTKVNPIPVASISASTSTTIAANGSVKLNASPSSGVTFQWFLNGSPISGATTKSYIATAGGSYTVAITKTGCTGTSAATTVTQTGVKEEAGVTSNPTATEEAVFELAAYPNPVSVVLTINVRGIEEVNATVQVMDFNGRVIAMKEMTTSSTTVDMTGYASGMYLIRYKDAEGRIGTIKITKE